MIFPPNSILESWAEWVSWKLRDLVLYTSRLDPAPTVASEHCPSSVSKCKVPMGSKKPDFKGLWKKSSLP